MGYTTSQVSWNRDRIAFDMRNFTILVWYRHFPPRFEAFHRRPITGGLLRCNGRDETQLDEQLAGHRYHCPICDVHLTSLLLCPKCGRRYDWPTHDSAKEQQA